MTVCVTAAPSLFLYINVLFAVYSGAALSTGCRLWWDPTLYAAVRELWREEYRVAAVALPLLAAGLLLLPVLAVRSLTAPSVRRRTLLAYCWTEGAVAAGGAAWAAWTWRRATAWARSPQAAELREAAALTQHVQPLLDQLDKWLPLPDTIKSLIQEAKADLPRNAYAACAALALLLLLLPAAAVLALLMLRRHPDRHREASDSVEAMKPLKPSLNNGRLVLSR